MTIDEHRTAGTCSVCGGRMDTLKGGANRITADEYRHGGCVEGKLQTNDKDVDFTMYVYRSKSKRMEQEYPPTIGFRLLHPAARQPTRAHPGDSGWDLYAATPTTVFPGRGELVDTGIAVEPPPGWVFTVRPRSGLSRNGIWCSIGTIDNGYRGSIGVQLWNFGPAAHPVGVGDKIAQIVLEQVHDCRWEERAELGRTERGSGGFGSTGT